MISSSCENRSKIDEVNMKELTVFINSFYDFINNDPRPEDIYGYFLNNDIYFYIQNNFDYTHRFVSNNQETQFTEFSDIINELHYKSKEMIRKEIAKSEFVKQEYDVPINDLFVLDYNVVYENLETTETFFIKKVDTTYKIYSFFINYNKNWDLD